MFKKKHQEALVIWITSYVLILLNPYCSCILLHELIIIRSSNIIIYIILYQLVLIFKKEIVWLAISPLQTKRPPPRRFLMTNLFGPTWRQLRRSCWRSEVWGKWKPMRRKLKIHQVIGSLLPRTYSFCWQASWIYTIDMCIYIYMNIISHVIWNFVHFHGSHILFYCRHS